MGGFVVGIMLGGAIGLFTGVYSMSNHAAEYYKVQKVDVTEQQCNIDKPSGTICEWYATWKSVEVGEK